MICYQDQTPWLSWLLVRLPACDATYASSIRFESSQECFSKPSTHRYVSFRLLSSVWLACRIVASHQHQQPSRIVDQQTTDQFRSRYVGGTQAAIPRFQEVGYSCTIQLLLLDRFFFWQNDVRTFTPRSPSQLTPVEEEVKKNIPLRPHTTPTAQIHHHKS